jgi:hypothetical protein
MVSSIRDLWLDDGLIEEKSKHVVNFKLNLAINNTCTGCVWLLYLLIVIIPNTTGLAHLKIKNLQSARNTLFNKTCILRLTTSYEEVKWYWNEVFVVLVLRTEGYFADPWSLHESMWQEWQLLCSHLYWSRTCVACLCY